MHQDLCLKEWPYNGLDKDLATTFQLSSPAQIHTRIRIEQPRACKETVVKRVFEVLLQNNSQEVRR